MADLRIGGVSASGISVSTDIVWVRVVLRIGLIYSCVYIINSPGIPGGTGYICLLKAMTWSEIDESEETLTGRGLFGIAGLVRASVIACTPRGAAVPVGSPYIMSLIFVYIIDFRLVSILLDTLKCDSRVTLTRSFILHDVKRLMNAYNSP